MVHWNVAPRHDETDPDAIAQFALARAKTGSIVILHDELFDVQHSEAVGFAAVEPPPVRTETRVPRSAISQPFGGTQLTDKSPSLGVVSHEPSNSGRVT